MDIQSRGLLFRWEGVEEAVALAVGGCGSLGFAAAAVRASGRAPQLPASPAPRFCATSAPTSSKLGRGVAAGVGWGKWFIPGSTAPLLKVT